MAGKRKITANLTAIKETLSTGVEPLCDKLIEIDVISWETKDELDAIPGSQKKVDHILKCVISGGQEAYSMFIKVLGMCGYGELAETIESTAVVPRPEQPTTMDPADGTEDSELSEDDLRRMSSLEVFLEKQFNRFKKEQQEHNKILLDAQRELHEKTNQALQEKLSGVMGLIAELEKRRSETAELGNKYKTLQESYKFIQEKMKDTQSRLSSLNKETHNLKNELSSTTKEKVRIEKELDAAKKELETKETEYSMLYMELQQAKADLQKEPKKDEEFQKYLEAILRVESFIKDERSSIVKPEVSVRLQKPPVPTFSRNTNPSGVGGLRGDPAPRKQGNTNNRRLY